MRTEEEKASSIIFFWIVSTFVFSARFFFSFHFNYYVDFDDVFFAIFPSSLFLLLPLAKKHENIMQRWNRKIVTCNLSWEHGKTFCLSVSFSIRSFFIFLDLLVHPDSSCRYWCCCRASTKSLAFFTVAFFLPSKLSLISLFFFLFFVAMFAFSIKSSEKA